RRDKEEEEVGQEKEEEAAVAHQRGEKEDVEMTGESRKRKQEKEFTQKVVRKEIVKINMSRNHQLLQFQKTKEDENLWIASRRIWFDQPRPPDSSQTAPVKIGPSS
ncbi:hypothetical protein STEG23_016758, partial [Scotinomys teguina]